MDRRTNSIVQISPSENDVHNIKLLISECEVNISNIDEEKRKKWITQLHAFKMALCPAMRLPAEIVAEIFVQIRSFLKLRGTPFDSVFLSICRRWRNIAISTPALWSEMELDLCKRQRRFSNQMVSLQTWCERARAHPLSVTLRYRGHEILSEVNPIATLLPHLSNISTLRLTLPSTYFDILFALPQDSFPSLEVFYARRHYSVRNEYPQSFTTFQSTYRLRSMQFESPTASHLVLHPPPQLSELISKVYLDIPECLGVIYDCPDLEILELDAHCEPEVVANTMVSLPCLRQFTLNATDYDVCGVLFDHITLPVLRELTLNCFTPYRLWCHQSFQSLASRSSWNLDHLTLRHVVMSYHEFYECFSSLPSLLELNIDYTGCVGTQALAALTYKVDAAAPLLPKLQKFRLHVLDDLGDERGEAFVDMVESRWWLETCGPIRGIRRLEEVTLMSTTALALDESHLGRLRRCRREGLGVNCPKLCDATRIW